MRKRVFPRIIFFLLLNCVVFLLLAAVQFSHGSHFTQRIGEMMINGRYSSSVSEPDGRQPLDGGANVVFAGMEFRLAPSSKTGLYLVDSAGRRRQTAPEYITMVENGAVFALSGGAELSFLFQDPGELPELQISGKFAEGIAAVEIPLKTQKSSLVRDGSDDNDSLKILYNGSQYQFSRPLQGLDPGQLVLVVPAAAVSYRLAIESKEFNPADFIVPQAEAAPAFNEELSRWVSRNFASWGQMGLQPDEDTVIAWCGEAARRGSYRSAVSVVPASFSSSPLRTWESAVYQFDRRIGVWERAARSIGVYERDKIGRISRLLAEKDAGIFLENKTIEFLTVRNTTQSNQLLNNYISYVQEIDPLSITLEISPGILESCLAMDALQPGMENPFEPLVEHIYRLASENMKREGDYVFVFDDGQADTEFNLRLGAAIYKWEEKSGNAEWEALGRTLALSVMSLPDDNGLIPALLDSDFAPSGERVNTAKLYRILNSNEYLPHEIASGLSGIWAWSAASSINITRNNQQMDISVTFPVGETHYVMIRNVPTFALLQIYDNNWRRAVDFESYYDASGWYYFEQDEALVVKLRHRSSVERVRIYFNVPAPPPPPQEQPEAEQFF